MATAQVNQTWDADGNLRSAQCTITFDVLDDRETRADSVVKAFALARMIATGDDTEATP